MAQKLVIALGGNALQTKNSEPTAESQLAVVKRTCEYIAEISNLGYEMAVVTATVLRSGAWFSPLKPQRM